MSADNARELHICAFGQKDTEAIAVAIEARRGLRWLSLYNSRDLTPAIVSACSKLRDLIYIDLENTNCGDDDVMSLARGAKALEYANFAATDVSSAGVTTLVGLKSLRKLVVSRLALDGSSIGRLAGLERLECNFCTWKNVVGLRGCENLIVLEARGLPGASLREILRGMKHLKYIDIRDGNDNAEDLLESVRGCPNLLFVRVDREGCGAETVEVLEGRGGEALF